MPAGCLLATGAVAVVLSACGSSAAPRDDVQRTASASPTSAVHARDRLRLSVFRAPRGDNSQLTGIRQLIPKPLVAKFRIDFSTARFAMVARAQPLFVVRGAHAYCLVDRARSLTNCWSEETTRSGDASVTSICSPQLPPDIIEVGGVVPNGVRTVTILRGGRFTDETVGVRNNVFVAVLPAGDPLPLRLRWNGTGPRHSTGVPAGTTYSACGATR